ncbi:MAG: DUF502 domain-containing protein [Bacteroidales bacterium]|nr:DUF502 domain-containing protein [Bacteroidales bacterium]
MKKIASYFLQGLLYIIPIAVTLFVLVKCFGIADSLIDFMYRGLQIGPENRIPGLGLLLLLLIVTAVGYACPLLISPQMSKLINKTIKSAPLISVIYTSVRDLMSAFVGKKQKFGTPVLVSLDDSGIVSRLGFITTEDLSKLNIEGRVGVYLPNSYGWLGDLVLVPAERVTRLDAKASDVMKFIVSGGVTQIGSQDEQDTTETEQTDSNAK